MMARPQHGDQASMTKIIASIYAHPIIASIAAVATVAYWLHKAITWRKQERERAGEVTCAAKSADDAN
jgi:hypothetical protein